MNAVTNDFLDRFHRLGAKPGEEYGMPPAKKLSLLTRPSFVAERGRTFVWGDFSNIEARVLPWLAASQGAEEKLDIFRETDRNPDAPDVYVHTGHGMVSEDPNSPFYRALLEEVWAAYKDKKHPHHKLAKDVVRQAYGKVPELSLGFGGGVGALMAMAVNYGVYLDPATAKKIVTQWRAQNAWAPVFWGGHGRNGSYGLWGAANSALEAPNTIFPAGRVAFAYDPDYLGGTLIMALPDGRPLMYPRIKWEWREVTDKKTGKVDDRYQLTFLKGYGRSALWYGKFAENATQATAASILRRTLRRLRKWEEKDLGPAHVWMPTVMHTHDEIVTEVPEDLAEEAEKVLHFNMSQNGPWDQGLPLACETAKNWYYTKRTD